MKIAIIGAGSVGGTLGRILAGKGHEISFGVRDPQSEKVISLLRSFSGSATADSIQAAVTPAEVVILATPWEGTQEALSAAGDVTGKVLIDATNPIQLGMEGLMKGLQVGHTTSGAEEVAQWAQGARVVKAFNNIGANCYENTKFGAVKATAFICGNDAAAKQVTTTLAQDIGFEVVDVGPLTKARLLEPLGMLWIDLAIAGVGREFAISFVKR